MTGKNKEMTPVPERTPEEIMKEVHELSDEKLDDIAGGVAAEKREQKILSSTPIIRPY